MRTRKGWRQADSWTEAEARAALAECKEGGQTVVEYAQQHGIRAERLYAWRQRLKKAHGVASAVDTTALIPVTVRSDTATRPSSSRGIVIVNDGPLRIEIADVNTVSATWVAALIRTTREVGE